MSDTIEYYTMYTVEEDLPQEVNSKCIESIVSLMKHRNNFILYLDYICYNIPEETTKVTSREIYKLTDLINLEENYFYNKLNNIKSELDISDYLSWI